MPKTQKELDEMWARFRAIDKANRRRRWREEPHVAFWRTIGRPFCIFLAIVIAFIIYGMGMNGTGAWK